MPETSFTPIQNHWQNYNFVRDCLFNIFTATLHIWRTSPPTANSGRAISW
jgi:hypothetical protein